MVCAIRPKLARNMERNSDIEVDPYEELIENVGNPNFRDARFCTRFPYDLDTQTIFCEPICAKK